MNIHKKSNIINQWDDIISKEEWDKLYYEVRREVVEDIVKEIYEELIFDGVEEIDKIIEELNS